jgi:hypothetical protein
VGDQMSEIHASEITYRDWVLAITRFLLHQCLGF